MTARYNWKLEAEALRLVEAEALRLKKRMQEAEAILSCGSGSRKRKHHKTDASASLVIKQGWPTFSGSGSTFAKTVWVRATDHGRYPIGKRKCGVEKKKVFTSAVAHFPLETVM